MIWTTGEQARLRALLTPSDAARCAEHFQGQGAADVDTDWCVGLQVPVVHSLRAAATIVECAQ